MLEILLNLGLDVGYKRDRFPKILSKKGLKFVPSRGGSTIVFDLCLMVLPAKIDPVAEKCSREGHAYRACGTGRVKIILTLSTKLVSLHVYTSIVQVGIPGLKGSILEGKVFLAILLALHKQF